MDGLRALAVTAVIVYHLDASWLPGGYLGVDVFFVISGYLITSLLLSEQIRTGRVALREFWLRRARRLLPALAVLLVATVLVAAVFARDALQQMQWDVPASALYVMNWRLVFQHQSYVAALGRPPLLQHLWSLSVEEQFYLLWPPSLLLLRRRLSRGQLAFVAAAGALLSAVLMGVLFRSSDPSAVYFATETHAQGLLIGCALAAAVPPWRMSATIDVRARRLIERAGVLAVVLVVLGCIVLQFGSEVTYRGGLFAVDLAAGLAVIAAAHPASRLGRPLSWGPIRWIGLRSYALYLWHWPVFELTRPGVDFAARGPVVQLLRVAVTIALAEASYRWVEQPGRKKATWVALRSRLATSGAAAGLLAWRPVAVIAAPVVVLAAVLATAPGPDVPAVLSEGATPAAKALPPLPSTTVTLPPDHEPTGLRLPVADRDALRPVPTTIPRPPPTTVPPSGPVPPADEPILALGDSVMLAASPALEATIGPGITVDASVGRQVGTGLQRLAAYRTDGALSHYHTLLIGLGTNGRFTPGQFATLMQLVHGVPTVVIYTVHAPRSWITTDNSVIVSGAAADPVHVHVADWNTIASGPGLLYPDGIHPNAIGANAYAQLLVSTLRSLR